MSKAEKDRLKQIQDKCQTILSQLLRDEDNKYCVDCDAKGPRWASWNLGIFLCIRCAGIHRNLGVHISKVKSVNLDTWTPEQVACLQQMGNSRGRAVYEANLPDNFRRPQNDSSLEAFIRAKYEQKKYIAEEWVPPPMPKPAFDIEDDKKKPKEKKTTRSGKSSGLEIPLPASGTTASSRPKPSTSPSNGVLPNFSTVKNETKSPVPAVQSAAVDLLGLDEPAAKQNVSDDPFGSFLAADTSTSITQEVTPSASNQQKALNGEEETLFSQLLPEDNQKKPTTQLTKESILSLYNQGPSISQQPPIGVPGGVYIGQGQQFVGNINPMPVMPTAVSATQVPQMIRGMAPTQVIGSVQMPGLLVCDLTPQNFHQPGAVGTNPFLAPASCTGVGGMYNAPVIQPSYNQIQQQMASMSISGIPAYSVGPQPVPGIAPGMAWNGQQLTGHTLSTNLWQ